MDKKALFIFQSKCLVPVLACNGWSVTTVEGVGSVKEGVSPIQVDFTDITVLISNLIVVTNTIILTIVSPIQVDFTDIIVLISNLIVVAIIVIMAIIIVRPRW